MPIPGDNGNPKAEREAHSKRIQEEGQRGGDVKKDVVMNPPAPKDDCIFGRI